MYCHPLKNPLITTPPASYNLPSTSNQYQAFKSPYSSQHIPLNKQPALDNRPFISQSQSEYYNKDQYRELSPHQNQQWTARPPSTQIPNDALSPVSEL